jgi:hypothetical protein
MHEYEIRILSAGHTVAVIDEVQRSDSVAIRSAKKFAGTRPFEVWRGSDCVYGSSSSAARARKTRNSPSL